MDRDAKRVELFHKSPTRSNRTRKSTNRKPSPNSPTLMKPTPKPLSMPAKPPRITPDFRELFMPVYDQQATIERTLNEIETESDARLRAKSETRVRKLHRALHRTLRNILEEGLDDDPEHFGHILMPRLLCMMLERNPKINLAKKAEALLPRLLLLEMEGTEVVMVQKYRDDGGFNMHTDLLNMGTMVRHGLTVQISNEHPYHVSSIVWKFKRRFPRILSRDEKAEFNMNFAQFHRPQNPLSGDVGGLLALLGSGKDDRLDKLLEGLSGSTAEDATVVLIGKEEVDAFFASKYMKGHPTTLQLLRIFRTQGKLPTRGTIYSVVQGNAKGLVTTNCANLASQLRTSLTGMHAVRARVYASTSGDAFADGIRLAIPHDLTEVQETRHIVPMRQFGLLRKKAPVAKPTNRNPAKPNPAKRRANTGLAKKAAQKMATKPAKPIAKMRCVPSRAKGGAGKKAPSRRSRR